MQLGYVSICFALTMGNLSGVQSDDDGRGWQSMEVYEPASASQAHTYANALHHLTHASMAESLLAPASGVAPALPPGLVPPGLVPPGLVPLLLDEHANATTAAEPSNARRTANDFSDIAHV
jgi:hypothetical protein